MTRRQSHLDVDAPPVLFTIGYETHTPDTLTAALKDAGVDHLVDVRERPLSRRKGFSKTALKDAVEAAGLTYTNVRALGAPPTIRQAYKGGGEFSDFAAAYRRHLDGEREAVDALAGLAKRERVALLCLEKDAAQCHRSLLAMRLARRGLSVVHL